MEFSPSVGIQVTEAIMGKFVGGDRDPAVPDFTKASFTIDGDWHDLDLSGIIEAAGANNPVILRMNLQIAPLAVGTFSIRRNGNVNDQNIYHIAVARDDEALVTMDATRKIEYKITGAPADWGIIDVTIRGWTEDFT